MYGKHPFWLSVCMAALLVAGATALAQAQDDNVYLPLVTGGAPAAEQELEQPAPPAAEQKPEPLPLPPADNPPAAAVVSSESLLQDDDVYLPLVTDGTPEAEQPAAYNAITWTVQSRLGVGATAPAYKVDVRDNANVVTRIGVHNPYSGTVARSELYLSTASNNGVLLQKFGTGATTTWSGTRLANWARLRTDTGTSGLVLTTGGSQPLLFGTNDTERMRINAGGGIRVSNAADYGVYVANPGIHGVVVNGPSNAGVVVTSPGSDGLYVTGPARYGVYVANPRWDGVNVYQPGGDGVRVLQPLGTGLQVTLAGNDGVFVGNPGNDGVFVGKPSRDGVRVENPGEYGVFVLYDSNTGKNGVNVLNGNIRVDNGSFIDSGRTLDVPDYVFEATYPLLSLVELRAYVAKEKHLPNMPTAAEIQADGVDLGAFNMRLLEKVEELTRYTLQQDDQIAALQAQNRSQQRQIVALQQQYEMQEARLAALEQAVGHDK